jgi:hypothetical protein
MLGNVVDSSTTSVSSSLCKDLVVVPTVDVELALRRQNECRSGIGGLVSEGRFKILIFEQRALVGIRDGSPCSGLAGREPETDERGEIGGEIANSWVTGGGDGALSFELRLGPKPRLRFRLAVVWSTDWVTRGSGWVVMGGKERGVKVTCRTGAGRVGGGDELTRRRFDFGSGSGRYVLVHGNR